MRPPEILTEKDFFAREFPAPANHYRPLALLAPPPGQDASFISSLVGDLASRGYGGMVLDPVNFGPEFLGESWFAIVGRYLEACRLTGLFLWVLDGFTTGSGLAAILDEVLTDWRGWELRTFTIHLRGPDRLSLAFTDPGARLLSVLARPLEGAGRMPIDLRPHLSEGMLEWTPPPGRWEILCFRAARSPGPPARSFAWTDAKTVSAWIEIGFTPYRELFGRHFGRAFQGFFILCPTRPLGHQDNAWPLDTPEPSQEEIQAFYEGEAIPPRVLEAVRQNYLLPLHEWCWSNRLRLAGYRLGGEPIPQVQKALDLGGLPDLDHGAPPPDPEELAGLAGLARSFRQERVVSLLPLSGEAVRDRATVSGLAAAGADLFLARPPVGLPPGWERALNDYAARLAMAGSAGGPTRETSVRIEGGPHAFRAAGRQALALARRGLEAACVLPDEEGKAANEEAPGPAEIPSPPPLALRARCIDDWQVYLIFNPAVEPWRGSLALPRPGQVEIWSPATGDRRPAPILTEGEGAGARLPLVIEAGEAVLAVIRRLGRPGPVPKSAYVRAHLRLPRGWDFVAIGGNVKPLSWEMAGPGRWRASLALLSAPLEAFLEELPAEVRVYANGMPLPEGAGLGGMLRPGTNLLELAGSPDRPRTRLRGDFICRGEAIAPPPPVIAGPWTQNGFPYFPGPGLYRQEIEIPAELAQGELPVWLQVGGLAGYALVRLNGVRMGSLAWPPYRLPLGSAGILRPGPNLLELEIYASPASPAWAFKGLLGEVSLLFEEKLVGARARDG